MDFLLIFLFFQLDWPIFPIASARWFFFAFPISGFISLRTRPIAVICSLNVRMV